MICGVWLVLRAIFSLPWYTYRPAGFPVSVNGETYWQIYGVTERGWITQWYVFSIPFVLLPLAMQAMLRRPEKWPVWVGLFFIPTSFYLLINRAADWYDFTSVDGTYFDVGAGYEQALGGLLLILIAVALVAIDSFRASTSLPRKPGPSGPSRAVQ